MWNKIALGILFGGFALYVIRFSISTPEISNNQPLASPIVIYAPAPTAAPVVVYSPVPQPTTRPAPTALPTLPPIKWRDTENTPRPMPTLVPYEPPVYKPIQYTETGNTTQYTDPPIIVKDPTLLAECLADVEVWRQEQISNGMNVDDEVNPLNRVLVGKKTDCTILYGNP